MKTRTLLLTTTCALILGGQLAPVTSELLCEYSFETAEFYKMEGYGGMKRSCCVRENGHEAGGIINEAIGIVQPPWFETKTSRKGGRCLGAHHLADSRDIKDRTEWEWVKIPKSCKVTKKTAPRKRPKDGECITYPLGPCARDFYLSFQG